MSVGARFDRFLSNIEPTANQRSDAIVTHQSVRNYLEGEYVGSSSFLIGSYKKETLVRPPSDIDVMFVLPFGDFERVDRWTGNKQSRLLQEVKGKLDAKYSHTDMKADGPVVQVFFSDYKVEIAPCFKLTSGGYWICNTRNGGSWKADAPISQMDALTASNKVTSGNTKRLIKMMKIWKRVCSVPLRSFALEILVMDFLAKYANASQGSTFYDWLVRDFLEFLMTKRNRYAFVAGTQELITLGDEWFSKAESAHNRAVKAVEFEAAEAPASALEEWQKIFGYLFPG